MLTSLSLMGYRNIMNTTIHFHPGMNLFVGNNAQGKTNLLEAIYYCAVGRSHRTRSDNELIRFDVSEAHIKAVLEKEGEKDTIDVHLKKDKPKGIAVNTDPVRRLGELFGIMQVVIFAPEDLQIVNSGPANRRRFIDMQICQLSRLYYHHLKRYHRVLKQRNALLKQVNHNQMDLKKELAVWDVQLAQHGSELIRQRLEFIQKAAVPATDILKGLTDGNEVLALHYLPHTDAGMLLEKLRKTVDRDIAFRTTTVGPHKDDLSFSINGLDVKTYGSQGQKRSCAIALKLAETQVVKDETGEYPLLLLDDVLSELDGQRQRFLFSYIAGMQSIITAAGIEDVLNEGLLNGMLFKVDNGRIERGRNDC